MFFFRKEKIEPDYVWVEGFKFTDANMCGMNHFQYKLGENYSIPDEPVMCKNGFHFCLTLSDCLRWYGDVFERHNRFFHVKALVNKKDIESYTYWCKSVAKEIVIVSEVSDDDLLAAIKEIYQEVETLDDLTNYKSYKLFLKDKIRNLLHQDGFSDVFISLYTDNYYVRNRYIDRYEHIKAIISEDISHDLKVYELLKILEK